MPALTLPPSFTNSFWSQGYRRGLETLYGKLEQGVDENLEVFNFIKARALAENDLANALLAPGPTGSRGTGFDSGDGATLFMAFRALQSESVKQGEAHKTAAHELANLVADPFGEWASGYAERIKESRTVLIDGWLKAYEKAIGDVDKLKHAYMTRTRRADEAEDDAKFAPGTNVDDKYTSSPRMSPTTGRPFKRTASVSERISQRLKELRQGFPDRDNHDALDEKTLISPSSPVFSAKSEGEHDENAPQIPSKDKGKGKEVLSPPPPLSPPLPEPQHSQPKISFIPSGSPIPPPPPSPIVLAGLSLPPQAVSQLLTRAASELPLRKVRFPILGEYADCFSGEEFVTWLKENVDGFGGSLDRAEDAAKDLTEREGALRRIGELGNRFENGKEAYFQFRSKAFEFHFPPESELLEHQGNLNPVADNLLKRTSAFVSVVQKAVSSAAPTTSEPPHLRARHEAENADKIYRVAVRKLDRQRLGLEEKIEDTLKTLQRWEMERLRAVKMVLLQYQGTLVNFPTAFSASLDRSSTVIASFQPENDLVALIEQYRTGPFRPSTHSYESMVHDRPDIVFGIDLRKWAGEGGWNAVRAREDQKEPDAIPNVVRGLLAGLNEAYEKLPNDSERRKSWIYDVPLPAVHHLREAINTLPPDVLIPSDLLAKYDAPVIASTLKLWALELDPPLFLWEGWDDVRKLYPNVGAVAGAEVPEQQRVEDLQVALLKLPKIHLLVLDAIIEHLKHLIDTTQVEESTEVYITKLGLSLGRAILRPKFETEMSIQDRHPTLLFIDLVKNYADVLPKVIARKKRESLERPMPIRKRTKMVDQRLSRSRISVGADPQQLLAAQHAAQHGPSRSSSPHFESQTQDKSKQAPALGIEATKQSEASEAPPAPVPPPVPPAPVSIPPPAPPADTYVPPPRPVFAEARDSYLPPPRPTFAPEQVDETDEAREVVISPPTPLRSQSPVSPPAQSPVSAGPPTSKADDSETVLAGKTSLQRSGSGEASRVRGPRGARPVARGAAPGLGSSSARSTPRPSPAPSAVRPVHSRGPSSVTLTPEQAKEYAPKKHGGKANAAIFSRRTVASDAEDNILDK